MAASITAVAADLAGTAADFTGMAVMSTAAAVNPAEMAISFTGMAGKPAGRTAGIAGVLICAYKRNKKVYTVIMNHRGIEWSADEVDRMLSLYRSGLKIADISSSIQRSESAIQKKLKEYSVTCRKKNWTNDEENKLVELFNSGKSNQEIAEALRRELRAVQGKLVRLGYKRKTLNVWKNKRRNDFWTENEKSDLIRMVNAGSSANTISENLNRSTKSIFYMMKELGIHILEKTQEEKGRYRRVYHLKDNYFEKIDTQTKAYFLGWMLTDGWVDDYINSNRGKLKSNKIGLKLNSKDKDVLEQFKQELDINVPLKSHEPRTSNITIQNKNKIIASSKQYSLEFTSAKMQRDLAKYGIVPRKTAIAAFPQELPVDFYPGFIAGVISGDGCIDIKKNHGKGLLLRCSIAGTKGLLESIKSILVMNINFNSEKKLKSTISPHLYILEMNQTETLNLHYWFQKNGTGLMRRKNKLITDFINGVLKGTKTL